MIESRLFYSEEVQKEHVEHLLWSYEFLGVHINKETTVGSKAHV